MDLISASIAFRRRPSANPAGDRHLDRMRENTLPHVILMKTFISACAAAFFLWVASGVLAQSVPIDEIAVFDATQVSLDRYTVVQRLGLQDWHSAIRVPVFSDEASARNAALAEARRSGADAVVNLHCLKQSDSLFSRAGYYCYGNAIKVKNERRVLQ